MEELVGEPKDPMAMVIDLGPDRRSVEFILTNQKLRILMQLLKN